MPPLIITVFSLAVSGVLFLLHFVIYKVISAIFALSPGQRVALGMGLGILGLSFVAASVLSFFSYDIFTRIYYSVSAIWLGIATYLFLASCLYIIFVYLVKLPGVSKLFVQDASFHSVGAIFLVTALIVALYGVIHAQMISVKTVSIDLSDSSVSIVSPASADSSVATSSISLVIPSSTPQLPKDWHGKKAVWVSDIHLGAVHGRGFAEDIVSKINDLKSLSAEISSMVLKSMKRISSLHLPVCTQLGELISLPAIMKSLPTILIF
jgi:hypothetical protein